MTKRDKEHSTTVRSSKQRCKGNVTGQFELLPTDLNHYVALKHIQPADIYTYFLLLQFDNKELGYAYPPVTKLMELTGSSKVTVLSSLKRLEQAGLIEKAKSKEFANKNIYYVYKPLTASELNTESVNEVQAHEARKEKIQETARQDKERLDSYLQDKATQDQQQQLDNVITLPLQRKTSNTVTPITPQETTPNFSPEELALLKKAEKLKAVIR